MVPVTAAYMAVCCIDGFFPITSPVPQKGGYISRRCHLTTVLSVIWALYPVAMTICCFVTNSFGADDTAKPSLAFRIMYYSTSPMPSIVNMLLRLTAVAHCKSVLEVIKYLWSRQGLRTGFTSYSIRYLAVLAIFGCLSATHHIWIAVEMVTTTTESIGRNCKLANLQGFINILIIIEWYHKRAGLLLALVFIMMFGLVLAELHQELCYALCAQFHAENPTKFEELKKVELELGIKPFEPKNRGIWLNYFGTDLVSNVGFRSKDVRHPELIFFATSHKQKLGSLNYDGISKEFKSMKVIFRQYEELAGIFSIIILVGSAAGIVEHVGNLAFKLGPQGRTVAFLLETLFYMFMVAHFGEFISSKVEENRDELRDAVGHFGYDGESALEKVSEWIIGWDWKLSAKNVFVINHRVIPAIFGTVMTYFIFIFQLRMSEIEDQPKTGSNVTAVISSDNSV